MDVNTWHSILGLISSMNLEDAKRVQKAAFSRAWDIESFTRKKELEEKQKREAEEEQQRLMQEEADRLVEKKKEEEKQRQLVERRAVWIEKFRTLRHSVDFARFKSSYETLKGTFDAYVKTPHQTVISVTFKVGAEITPFEHTRRAESIDELFSPKHHDKPSDFGAFNEMFKVERAKAIEITDVLKNHAAPANLEEVQRWHSCVNDLISYDDSNWDEETKDWLFENIKSDMAQFTENIKAMYERYEKLTSELRTLHSQLTEEDDWEIEIADFLDLDKKEEYLF